MIKYCKSCGKEYSGEYCNHCGYGKTDVKVKAFDKYKVNKPERFMTDEEKAERAEKTKALRKSQVKEHNASVTKKRKLQKRNSQWGFIILAVIIFLSLLLLLLYANGYIFAKKDKTEVITTYFKSIENNDFEGYLSTMLKPMAKNFRDYADEHNLSDTDAMKELYSDYIEGFGENYTITLEYGAEEKQPESVLRDSENLLENEYGESFKIKEAYKVAVTATFKGEKADEIQYAYVYVAKIGRYWYILNIEN